MKVKELIQIIDALKENAPEEFKEFYVVIDPAWGEPLKNIDSIFFSGNKIVFKADR